MNKANGKIYQMPEMSMILAETSGENALIKLVEKKYNVYPMLLLFWDVNFATRDITDAFNI